MIHAKLLIIDDRLLVFGTGNFSQSGLVGDSNIFMTTDDKGIVRAFTEVYSAIVCGRSYSETFSNLEIHLTPSSDAKMRIIKRLTNARNEILFLSYAFTDTEILSILKLKSAQGIKVKELLIRGTKIFTRLQMDDNWNAGEGQSQQVEGSR